MVEELRGSGDLDGLLERIDSGQVALTGSDGSLPALLKEALERGLQAELSDHLDYEKGEHASVARGNARNGTATKTISSEVGSFENKVPQPLRQAWQQRHGLLEVLAALSAAGGPHPLKDIQGVVGVPAGPWSWAPVSCGRVGAWPRSPRSTDLAGSAR